MVEWLDCTSVHEMDDGCRTACAAATASASASAALAHPLPPCMHHSHPTTTCVGYQLDDMCSGKHSLAHSLTHSQALSLAHSLPPLLLLPQVDDMYSDMDSGKVLCPLCKENWLLHNNGAQVRDSLLLAAPQRRAGERLPSISCTTMYLSLSLSLSL